MRDTTLTQNDLEDRCFNDVLSLVAIGEEREATFGVLIDSYPMLEADTIRDLMADGHREAIAQGIDPEDVDPSWTD